MAIEDQQYVNSHANPCRLCGYHPVCCEPKRSPAGEHNHCVLCISEQCGAMGERRQFGAGPTLDEAVNKWNAMNPEPRSFLTHRDYLDHPAI